jgi:VIT1/CCC1 family predicted Fe2+/Mn2+ transporter
MRPAKPLRQEHGRLRDARRESHLSERSNWLRAAVLGANDGIVSTASLVLGVAAAGGSARTVVTAGIAGLAAGALSMAAGEYVSVSSQRDTEQADLELERWELENDPEGELDELAGIYERRGVPAELARAVAVALTERGALPAHARDELGLDEGRRARPLQAASASALAFSAGAVLPLAAIGLAPADVRVGLCIVVTLGALALLGAIGAQLGGAPKLRAAVRVLVWGAAAMLITSGIGALTGELV